MKRLCILCLALSLLLTACVAAPAVTPPDTTPTTTENAITTTTATASTSDTAASATTTLSDATTTADGTTAATAAPTTTKAPTTTTTTPTTTGTTTSPTTKPTSPPVLLTEHKTMWVASVANLDFPSRPGLSASALKAECDTIVSTCVSLGYNTLYFQVRPGGDALYPSSYFPSSRYLSGTQGDPLPFDILDYMLTAAHKAGLKLYAWVNPVRVRNKTTEALSADNPATKHPDWVVDYADGKTYYDIGLPEVRQLVADGVGEIVQNYAVDGIVFDDYFYPYPRNGAEFDDAETRKQYDTAGNIGNFRRDSVNRLIRACFNRIKSIRSSCEFGVSPFGIRKNTDAGTSGMESFYSIYCDPEAWISEGTVDFIEPQLYWAMDHNAAPFKKLADYWSNAVKGTSVKLRIAMAPYKRDPAQATDTYSAGELARQIAYAKTLSGFNGTSQFRYTFAVSDTFGVRSELTAAYKG